jgi:hypothetical protein
MTDLSTAMRNVDEAENEKVFLIDLLAETYAANAMLGMMRAHGRTRYGVEDMRRKRMIYELLVDTPMADTLTMTTGAVEDIHAAAPSSGLVDAVEAALKTATVPVVEAPKPEEITS